jgi:RNA polymerase sigma factor (sigma-70 family)
MPREAGRMTQTRSRGKRQPVPPDDFGDFYGDTRLRTLNAMRRLTSDNDLAHEATQEAYARMFSIWLTRQSRSRDDNHRYTLAIARNLVLDWFRRNRRIVGLDDLDEPAADDPGLGIVLDRMVIGRAVRVFLDQQPIGRRVVGVLFFLDGCSYREIARELGIRESTVRNQVHRLRVLLKPYKDRFNEMMREASGHDEPEG